MVENEKVGVNKNARLGIFIFRVQLMNNYYPGHSPSFLCASTKRRGGLRQSRKTGQFVIPRSRGIQSAKPTCVIFAFITQVDAKRQLDPGLRRDDGAQCKWANFLHPKP